MTLYVSTIVEKKYKKSKTNCKTLLSMWIIQKILRTNGKTKSNLDIMAMVNLVYLQLSTKKRGRTLYYENDQSCNSSLGLNNLIISQICSDNNIHTIKSWSDGCASQCRRQYVFCMFSKSDAKFNLQRNCFEPNHRKGTVDGIGGTVKHAVYFHVLTKQVIIKLPRSFADYAKSILSRITVQYIDKDSMVLDYQDGCREKAIYIPGTIKVH